jgi:hypothetical protein
MQVYKLKWRITEWLLRGTRASGAGRVIRSGNA